MEREWTGPVLLVLLDGPLTGFGHRLDRDWILRPSSVQPTIVKEALKVAFRSNMHMDSRVIEIVDIKSEAIVIALSIASLQGHCPLVVVKDTISHSREPYQQKCTNLMSVMKR